MNDEDRLYELERNVAGINKDVGILQAKITPLEEGVANFRAFQVRGNSYFDRSEAVLDADEKRRKRNLAIIAIVAPFILAIGGFFGVRAWSIWTDVVKIVHEWHTVHKSEIIKESTSSNQNLEYSVNQIPSSDAQLPDGAEPQPPR